MLSRIKELLNKNESFAFETTLASKSFVRLLNKAKSKNFDIIILFLWLNSVKLAMNRVKVRVMEGGHSVPENIITRRYHNGLKNLFELYMPIANKWFLIDNSGERFEFIAEGTNQKLYIKNGKLWSTIKSKYDES